MKFFFFYTLRKLILMLVLVSILFGVTAQNNKAYAQCCGCCDCWNATVFDDLSGWVKDWLRINFHIFMGLYLHRIYFWDWQFWSLYLTPAMSLMAEQLAAVSMQQMQIIGSFLDAKEQLEAQQDLQRMMARAHKDYHPSIEMCEIGSRVKSLAMSERRGELSTLAMSQYFLNRMLGNKSSISSLGDVVDIKNRLEHFKEKFCDRADNNGGLSQLCTAPYATATAVQLEKYNKDIDFPRTYARPLTLNINLTDASATDNEDDVLSLGNNLYGFSAFPKIDPEKIANNPKKPVTSLQHAYLDLRSYVAKQNVAENSFNALIALKSEGTAESKEFLKGYLKQLGIPDEEMDSFLGNNPSYYAQMEILTKLAYQKPAFYTNLYDKPANVARKGVAIQAIGLMQKFDLFKSYLRTESSLSVLLELTVEDLQREVEDSIRNMGVSTDEKT